MSGEASRLPRDYPPVHHVLRDLALWSEAGADPPQVPDVEIAGICPGHQ